MKTVQVCNDAFAAELLKGRLLNEGIEAQVIHGNIEQVIPYSYGMPSLKPQVVVSDEDYPRAVELLQEPQPTEAAACPYCGSEDVTFGLHDGSLKRRVAMIGAVLLSLLTLGPLGKIQGSYYCRSCKKRFS